MCFPLRFPYSFFALYRTAIVVDENGYPTCIDMVVEEVEIDTSLTIEEFVTLVQAFINSTVGGGEGSPTTLSPINSSNTTSQGIGAQTEAYLMMAYYTVQAFIEAKKAESSDGQMETSSLADLQTLQLDIVQRLSDDSEEVESLDEASEQIGVLNILAGSLDTSTIDPNDEDSAVLGMALETTGALGDVVGGMEALTLESGERLSQAQASVVVAALSNVLSVLTSFDSGTYDSVFYGNLIKDTLTTVGQLLLLSAEVGEDLIIETETFWMGMVKSTAENPACSKGIEVAVSISSEFANNKNASKLDCVNVRSSINLYSAGNEESEGWKTFFVNFDLSASASESGETATSRRRRRLQEGDTLVGDEYLSPCEPIILKIPTVTPQNWSTGENSSYPACQFFNETTSKYDTAGCYR